MDLTAMNDSLTSIIEANSIASESNWIITDLMGSLQGRWVDDCEYIGPETYKITRRGGDWDILNKLTLTFNSSMRMNDIKFYKTDESDNDDDGEVDESGENWTINSSGFNLTLGYRF